MSTAENAEKAERGMLRRLRLGELLDQAIWLYRRNFWRALAIALAVQLPFVVFGLVSALRTPTPVVRSENNPPAPLAALVPWLVLYLTWLLLYEGIGLGALVQVFAGSILGQRLRFAATVRRLLAIWVRLILALLATLVVDIVIVAWTAVPMIGWLTGLGILFFFLLVVVPLLAPVIVVENQGVLRSLRRTWELARQSFWWVVVAMVVLFLFNQVIIAGPIAVFASVLSILNGSDTPSGLSLTLQQLSWGVLEASVLALYLPLMAAGITLIYFQLRVRAEGLDLALASGGSLDDGAPAVRSFPLVRTKELGRFALLSVGAILFVILVYMILLVAALVVFAAWRLWPR
jgi:hypothetical protein